MDRILPEDPEAQSLDLLAENVEWLKLIFPEAFVEGKIDFETLKSLLGGTVADTDEKYGLNWHGKRRAKQIALTPSNGTLRPCPIESVDWDTTKNLMIEGDNLEVLKLLQKSYSGKVKLIYIDPPYNKGKDFVYPDDFRDGIKNYQMLTGQIDTDGRRLTSNVESSGRFHTDWLNMMYPRLKLARNLLREDGIIFISIDDGEQERLRLVMDELFGEANFLANFVWKRKAGGGDDSDHVAAEHEYVLCFAKDSGLAALASVLHESPAMTAKYNRSENGLRYYLERLDKTSLTYAKAMDFPIECPDGTFVEPPQPNPDNPTTSWRWGKETVAERRSELVFLKDKSGTWRVYTKTWEPKNGVTPRSLLVDKEHGRNRDGTQELDSLMGPKVFSNPKPTKMLSHLFTIAGKDPNCIMLDFFSGSGSSAHALMRLNALDQGNRRYIVVQLPEKLDPDTKEQKLASDYCDKLGKPRTIAELTKERLRRAGKKVKHDHPLFSGDTGFRVFKLDSTSIQAWDPQRNDLEASLIDSIDHIKAGRTEIDILYELLLKLGLDLCVPIETKEIIGESVKAIGGGILIACLADQFRENDVEPMAHGIVAWRDELAPAGDVTCVFRDDAFADDVAKTNLVAILEQSGIKNVRSL